MIMRRTSGIYPRSMALGMTGTHAGSVDTGTASSRCVTDQDGLRAAVKQDLLQHLKDYMQGFLNDPAHKGSSDGSPDGRASWPDAVGNPTDAWNSPLAHRKLFEWRAGGPGGRLNADGVRALLDAIGVDQTICSTSVADGIIHGMDKGADDNLTTWEEYLNSIFHIGPVADVPTLDPTVAQIAAETGSPPPSSGSSKKGGLLLGSAILAAVNKAAAPSTSRASTGVPKNAKIKPGFVPPAVLQMPSSKTPAIAGAVLAGGLLAVGVPFPLAALPLAIGTMVVYGSQRESV